MFGLTDEASVLRRLFPAGGLTRLADLRSRQDTPAPLGIGRMTSPSPRFAAFMSLINPALLYGFAFIAVPVLLHFLMRVKPKKLMFPALRLIQKRRLQNVRRMRLRHVWLLLLRIAVLAAIVAALLRPSLPAAEYGLSLRESLTLGAIGVVAVATYFGLKRWWQKQKLPNHVQAARRTYLSAGLGALSVVLVALLVGWPYQQRVLAEITSPVPTASSQLPAAAVFLFDTSLSMAYTQEGETRLDVAKKIAVRHLASLPARSRLAIGETATSDTILFQADLAAAKGRLDALKTMAVAVPLNDRLRSALATQEEDRQRTLETQSSVANDDRSDRFVREVYLFTDLAQSGWSKNVGKILHDELQRLAWLGVYVIDVGVTQPKNVGLTKLRLSRESVSVGGETVVSVSLPTVGMGEQTQVVEFLLESEAGELVKKDQRVVAIDEKSVSEVQFTARGLSRSTHRGRLKLVSSDPLLEDNQLDFAVRVDAGIKVLAVSPTQAEAFFLQTALEVQGYSVTFVPEPKLEATDIRSFDVVCFVNVARPTEAVWKKLDEYVSGGGGLAVFLGSAQFEKTTGINSVTYNTEAAQSVLPGKLAAVLKFSPAKSLDLRDTTHPVLKKFEGAGVAAELMTVDVRRYWVVDPHESAKVIAAYSDNKATPALLERIHGLGRTVMLTTAVDLTRDWSELARTPPFHFLALTDQTMQYLSHRSAARVNYSAGEDVLLPLNRERPMRRYLLRKPSSVQLPGDVPEGETELRITGADERGNYEVVPVDGPGNVPGVGNSGHDGKPLVMGFVVNAAAGESDFARLTVTDLDNLLGEKRYSLADSIEGLERSVTTGRLGVEVMPLVLGLLIVAFCLEHTVANRFYQTDQAPEAVA